MERIAYAAAKPGKYPGTPLQYLTMPASNGVKVLLAMSGGVDSSVAAALLIDQGYQVVGCFMRLGSEESPEDDACSTPAASASGGISGARSPATRAAARSTMPRTPAWSPPCSTFPFTC